MNSKGVKSDQLFSTFLHLIKSRNSKSPSAKNKTVKFYAIFFKFCYNEGIVVQNKVFLLEFLMI